VPWFAGWNYRLLQVLFHIVPHSATIDSFFEFLVSNHLVSTWIFAACFYWFWAQDDEERSWRRQRLVQVVIAIAVTVVFTLLIRPWIRWPAPGRNPSFRDLYPPYFWNEGTLNSFPSHATLVYFSVAVGFWSFNRRLTAALTLLVLALVSVPRIYLGGHYPIDVIASILLGVAAVALLARSRLPNIFAEWLERTRPSPALREFLLLIWIFELGEGFQGSMSILTSIRHLLRH
jgi:undecaprenyl-diphosphatase